MASFQTAFLAALAFSCASAFSRADESAAILNPDAQAALAILRPLSPQGQAGVVTEMERSRRAGELGPAQVPLLTALVENAPWKSENRRRVVFLLARLGAPARAALEALSASEDETTRTLGAEGLELYSLIAGAASSEIDARKRALQALPEFAAAHREAVDPVIEILTTGYTRQEEPRLDVRIEALRSLVRFGERAAPVLVETLTQPEPFFFQYTKEALTALGPKAEDSLLAGLEHRDPLVRQRVIYVLIDIGIDDTAAETIRKLENDRDPWVQKAAARALAVHRARSARQ